MNKRRIISIILTSIIFLSSCAPIFQNNKAEQSEKLYSTNPVISDEALTENTILPIVYEGDSIPISRGLVAKMLAFSRYTSLEINRIPRTINFSDTEIENWPDRYINACIHAGFMSGGGDDFMSDMPLTLYQAQIVLDKLDPDNKVKIQIDETNKEKAISYALWMELFCKVLEDSAARDSFTMKEKFEIEIKDLIILATPKNNDKLKEWFLISSEGPFTYVGLYLDDYVDKSIKVLVKDKEIIGFIAVNSHSPVIENAYIVSKTESSITVFKGGAERTYQYNTSKIGDEIICDIKINGEIAENIIVYNETIEGIVKKVDSKKIELEQLGIYEFCDKFGVYNVTDGIVKWKGVNGITLGTETSTLIVKNGQICAVVISKTTLPESVRIGINTTGFASLYHANVSITSDEGFYLSVGEKRFEYSAGEILEVNKDNNLFKNGIVRIYVNPRSEKSKLTLLNIKRNNVNPKYRGNIEIGLEEKGFSIINNVAMDKYLYGVVPSEMPTGHGLEAAKVQAVTARSYAYNQYYANKFHHIGAHLDDSVNSQVYNNTPENVQSIKGVDETSGICLVYNGSVVSANYFSTSSGMTANSGEVWANTTLEKFPATTPEYLESRKQYLEADFGDLTIEKNADLFFKDRSLNAYDSSFPWFRWDVTFSEKQISDSINANLKTRYDARPFLIKTLNEFDEFVNLPIETIGTVQDVQVVSRGNGGNVYELILIGSEKTIMILTEYNIRNLIKPTKINSLEDIVLYRSDGSSLSNYSLLPSSFFTMDKTFDTDGKLASIKFFGGGNGHGVGMSQNGVKGMIDRGFTFEEILNHYYKNTEVRKML